MPKDSPIVSGDSGALSLCSNHTWCFKTPFTLIPHSSPASTPHFNITSRKYCLHGCSASSLQSPWNHLPKVLKVEVAKCPGLVPVSIQPALWPAPDTPLGASFPVPFLAVASCTPSVLPPAPTSVAAPPCVSLTPFSSTLNRHQPHLRGPTRGARRRGVSALHTRISPAFHLSFGAHLDQTPLSLGVPVGRPRMRLGSQLCDPTASRSRRTMPPRPAQ